MAGDANDEEEIEEIEEDGADTTRSIMSGPGIGDTCPHGHMDWEKVRRKNLVMKRCRICKVEIPFRGQVL